MCLSLFFANAHRPKQKQEKKTGFDNTPVFIHSHLKMLLIQGSIPEVRDEVPGAIINQRVARISTFHDLGPPDLVALTKHTPNTKDEVGTYLYYTGLDNSSPSSVAAHLNQLANVIGSKPQVWFGKVRSFKVSKATYASFNAFSRCDVIVSVNIPGTVSCHVIDSNGEKLDETDDLWKEVYVSGVVRALLTNEENEEHVNSVIESRNLNPFFSKDLATQFFDYFEELFFNGPTLGSVPEVQNPSLIDNYLVDAFLKAVQLTQMYDYALESLERLRQRDEIVVALIAKVLLLHDEEIKAIKTIHEGLLKSPRDANLLVLQSEFLTRKGQLKLALQSAIRAVNSSPSEFKPWYNLSLVYLSLGDIDNSLLSLNSCPMATYKDQQHTHRLIPTEPQQLHLPLPIDVNLDEVYSLNSESVAEEHSQLDRSLVGLTGASLKSTHAKAYDVLTKIVLKTGWEQLLKYRAKIFVMEEEYRSKSSSTANVAADAADGHSNDKNAFKKKRLCERWLDGLFMILYDDLKTYTTWQAELIHFQAQQSSYEKSGAEWELLGVCAYRLHHFKEAAYAFKQCLELRFAPASTRQLMKYYKAEVEKLLLKSVRIQSTKAYENGNGHLHEEDAPSPLEIEKKVSVLDESILHSVIKLTVWNHRWYTEFAPFLVLSLAEVVGRDGLIKIQSQVSANFSEESGISSLLDETFQFYKIFEVRGSDS